VKNTGEHKKQLEKMLMNTIKSKWKIIVNPKMVCKK